VIPEDGDKWQEAWDIQLNKEIPKRLARHGKGVNRRLRAG